MAFDLQAANLLAAGATYEEVAEMMGVPLETLTQLLGTPRFQLLVDKLRAELELVITSADPDELLEAQKLRNYQFLGGVRDDPENPVKDRIASAKLLLEHTPSVRRKAVEEDVARLLLEGELLERIREGWRRAKGSQAPSLEGLFFQVPEPSPTLVPESAKTFEGETE